MGTREEFFKNSPLSNKGNDELSKRAKKGTGIPKGSSTSAARQSQSPFFPSAASDGGVAWPDDVMEEEKWLFELFTRREFPAPRPALKKEIWRRILELLDKK